MRPEPQPIRPFLLAAPLLLALAACQSTGNELGATRGDTGTQAAVSTPLAAPDACLARDMVPVSAPDAVAADERAMEERQFAVPCPDQLDAEFIASLQRALIVRGYLEGQASGRMDEATAEAVRRYQRPRGLDSTILSLDAARTLGLVAVPREG